MSFTGMNCYAPDWLEADFILNSRQTTQNPHQNRLKTVNGDAIYCVAVKRCRRSRKPVFSTFRNRVRRRPAITLWQVAGRLTTRFTGDSTRDLTLESPWSKSHQPGKSTLESSHHNVLIICRDSHMNRGQVIGDSP